MTDRETIPAASTPDSDSHGEHDPLESPGPQDSSDPQDSSESPEGSDLTLGGYLEVHERPPAFSGSDEQPYTVSVEIETVEDLAKPYVCYLVFPRWAETGLGIVGHVETPVIWEGRSREEVRDLAHALPLVEVKRLLDEAVQRKTDSDSRADQTAMPGQ